MNTITQQIRELQHLPTARLVERYQSLFGAAARVRNAAWLRRQIAWKLQEREFGGLSDRAKDRLDELVARIDLPLHDATRSRPRPWAQRLPVPRTDANTPIVGTVLSRAWRGQELRVQVRENGFEWNGVVYRSLSAVAKAITGTTWNGRLFFGLIQRRAGA